ncbi:MAG TPA: cobyrinate a,c-diamide synthase [Thiothrix sp.]|nr:cobyrinate a,c-diamide synthase [Thiothrix sp.]
MPRLYISAAHKSSGKTTISIGLCSLLTQQGYIVQPYKKGPDYIDPLWLSSATQRACYNLDYNTMSKNEILSYVARYSATADVSIIEGNMGLYDGVAIDGSNSNAAVAKLTKTPVILVVDAQGVTRGVAPLLQGYQGFDTELNIAGVLFNKVANTRHETKLRQMTETYTDLPVVGAVRRSVDLVLTERHLGLQPFNENEQAQQQIETIAQQLSEQINIKQIVGYANSVEALPCLGNNREGNKTNNNNSDNDNDNKINNTKPLRIGICQDAAFSFYYPDDLLALEQAGAQLITINTLVDKDLPYLDGLFIGGGFPEAKMEALSANITMRKAIAAAIENGLPCYAECGGLMYLSQSIIWQGKQQAMVGVIPGDAVMHEKPQGRGYVKLRETAAMPWPKEGDYLDDKTIAAHEFHYSKLQNTHGKLTKKGAFVYSVQRGTGIDGQNDGWLYKNLLASYAHIRDTSKYHWASRFVAFIRQQVQ